MTNYQDPNDQQQRIVDEYDDFLRHSFTASGGGFLKKWQDDGRITIWLPPNIPPKARWMHRFNIVGEGRPKNAERGAEKIPMVVQMRWNCREREAILRKQRFRIDDYEHELGKFNSERQFPPIDCPHCMSLEWVRTEIREGRMDVDTVLFRYETPTESVTVTAGEWTGIFGVDIDKLPDRVVEIMRRLDISQKEIFKAEGNAAPDYLARVVEFNDPEAGMLMAPFSPALGAKIQKAIGDRIRATQKSRNPYVPSRDWICLELNYNANEKFEKKYDVVCMTEEYPDQRVIDTLAMVPSIDEDMRPGDPQHLLEEMQKYAQVEFPWNALFDRAIERFNAEEPWGEDGQQAAPPPQASPPRAPAPPQQRQAPPPPAPLRQAPVYAPPAAAPPPDDEPYACDVCEQPLPNPDATECPHCGARYDPHTNRLIYDPRAVGKWPHKEPQGTPQAAPPASPAPPPTPQAATPQAAPGQAGMPPARPSARRTNSRR